MGLQGFLEVMPALLADPSRLSGAPMITEEMYCEFDHAMLGALSIILGEIELVPSDADVPAGQRRRSQGSVVEVVRKMEQMLVEWRGGGSRR